MGVIFHQVENICEEVEIIKNNPIIWRWKVTTELTKSHVRSSVADLKWQKKQWENLKISQLRFSSLRNKGKKKKKKNAQSQRCLGNPVECQQMRSGSPRRWERKRILAATKAWKTMGVDFPLESTEWEWPCHHLDFSPVEWILDFWHSEVLENKVLLFSFTFVMVIFYSSHRKLVYFPTHSLGFVFPWC